VVALAILIALLVRQPDGQDNQAAGGSPSATTSDPTTTSTGTETDNDVQESGLAEVEVYEDLPTTHVPGEVTYDQSPPVGGTHSDVWLDCGAYDEPVRNENVVHDLEHGTVWITYSPGLDQASVDALLAALPQNGILSPYDGLDAPVVVTVWERQLRLSGADDPRLELFIDEFGAGESAPEPFASCAGGVPDAQGGEGGTQA